MDTLTIHPTHHTVIKHCIPTPPVRPAQTQIIVPFQKIEADFVQAFHVIDIGLLLLTLVVVVIGFNLKKIHMPKINVVSLEAAAKTDALTAAGYLKSFVVSKWTLLLIIAGSLIGVAFILNHLILSVGLGIIALIVGLKFGFDSLNPVTVATNIATVAETTLKNDATAALAAAEAAVHSMVTSSTPVVIVPAKV